MQNLIEGRVVKNKKVVVIEDLISTGGSSLKAVQALRDAGCQVIGMVSVFTYGFDLASKNFYDADVSLISLSDYGHMLRVAVEQNYVDKEQLISLKSWNVDPSNWRK
jgi:orotate phosphoribosyltransferase